MSRGAWTQDVVPPEAAATLCHVDLDVVGSRQIFMVKILDVVC